MADINDPIARQTNGRFTTIPLADRFWAKVEKTGSCWNWSGAKVARDGRGQLWAHGRLDVAPRVSWELHNGPIPEGLWVLHTCDNPACVRPAHLFLGTCSDNGMDSASKGRNVAQAKPELLPRGEAHGMSVLTDADIRDIRQATGSQRTIAKRFGVALCTIQNILHRRTWKHVD